MIRSALSPGSFLWSSTSRRAGICFSPRSSALAVGVVVTLFLLPPLYLIFTRKRSREALEVFVGKE